MQTDEHDIESSYEVGQEQLDAVDRMLEELDLEESFDRVPAAFRIVERFEQQRQQQEFTRAIDGIMANGQGDRLQSHHTLESDEDMEAEGDTQHQEESDSNDEEPFGYIPLDQGDDYGDEDEDDGQGQGQSDTSLEDNNGYSSMRDSDANSGDDGDNDEHDDGQGYDGYLRSRNRDGTVPVPVIPSSVQIDLEEQDAGAAEQIPEEDLKTIAQIISSFSLPAPDWARSIPEERWLPKIVQQAEAAVASSADASLPSREASGGDTERS
ncbi:hypothetical protein BGZ72_005954 [Mortierella alpina]|nr:hypothetical protein BGZ72_005954 [Mortierella alpina]